MNSQAAVWINVEVAFEASQADQVGRYGVPRSGSVRAVCWWPSPAPGRTPLLFESGHQEAARELSQGPGERPPESVAPHPARHSAAPRSEDVAA